MNRDWELLDCNFFVGHPVAADYEPCSGINDLLSLVSPAGITGGIVWHIAQKEYDAAEGNHLLAAAIEGFDSVYGCWTILPPQTGEVITKDFFDRMRRDRIVALRAFPELHRYQLRPAVFGTFLDELVERRIPLMLSVDGGTSWPVIYDLLEETPKLTCALCDVGIWGVDRQVWPLLERYPNVYVETSLLSLSESGIEDAVRRFGAGRVLFGTGFPARYAEASALQLLHAGISENDKAAIGSANLTRLISEVRL